MLKKSATSLHRTLQNAVVVAINDPDYSFSLPNLSDWESVVSSTLHEKERLEFIGDAIMHLSVALYLYRLFPDAPPGLYTNIRSALNANTTFTHLMVKAGAYELPSQSHSPKAAADSFEVIVAALYMERGFADVHAWVQEQYAPLIAAARESYDECFTTSICNIPLLSTKRHRGPPDPAGTPLLKKIRLSSGRHLSRSALMAQRVVNRMRSKGKVKLCLPAKKPNLPLEMRLHSCERRTPEPQGSSSLVIDLTADSDTDCEGGVSSNVTQTFQPSVKPLVSLSQKRRPPRLQSHPTPGVNQSFDEHAVCHQLPKQGSTALHRASASPVNATSSNPVACITLRTTSKSDVSQSHTPSGTHRDPIVVEDDETEY